MIKKEVQNYVGSLFTTFEEQLNHKNPLYILANTINWEEFETAFKVHYSEKMGAPSKPIRRMVGLLILKHIRNLSDESIVDQWEENAYYQYFCGEFLFAQMRPCSYTELVEFRKRIGKSGMELIFQESIRINGKDGEEKESITDTTVQEKNITYPTDAKLHNKIIQKCQQVAEKENIEVRQSPVVNWAPETNGSMITTRYYAQRYVYDKLHQDPAYRSSHTDLANFYTQNSNSDFIGLLQVNRDYYNIGVATLAEKNNYNLLFNQYNSIWDQISSFNESYNSSTNLIPWSQLMDELRGIVSQISSLNQTIKNRSIVEAQLVLNANGSLALSSTVSINEKTVNGIMLTLLSEDRSTLNSSELSTLESIASQCAYSGGRAVYSARAKLSELNNVNYDDDILCAASINSINSRSNSVNSVTLYPNPVGQYLNLEVPKEFINSSYKISSIDQKILRTGIINTIIQNINTDDLLPGVYMITVESKKESKVVKFIKQ